MIKLENIRWSDFFLLTLIPTFPHRKEDIGKNYVGVFAVEVKVNRKKIKNMIFYRNKLTFWDHSGQVYENLSLTKICNNLWEENIENLPNVLFSKKVLVSSLKLTIKEYIKDREEFLEIIHR